MTIDHLTALERMLGVLYRVATEPEDDTYISFPRNRVAAAEALGRLCLAIEKYPPLGAIGIMIPVADPADPADPADA